MKLNCVDLAVLEDALLKTVEPSNPRAVSIDWNVFKTYLNKNLSLFDFHPNSINSTNDLEQKITEFTEAVIDTHSHASRPTEIDRRNFTSHHINQLLKIKNFFRKRYHQTPNLIFKSHYNRAQSDLKRELKKYNDNISQKRLEGLNTADNSLWRTQRFFKSKRPKIPPLKCATDTAVTDQQKANLLATNIKNNFVGNERENDNYNQNDELINPTVNNFLSTPPTSFIEPALPDEIIHYIKHVNAKKGPWIESVRAGVNKMVIRSEGAVEYVMVGVSRRPTQAIWRGKEIEPVQYYLQVPYVKGQKRQLRDRPQRLGEETVQS
ncbi:hypothetical protein TNCV_1422561 [Trichonephila clavipes]|nr:hypothetical protein TNCV_1422561 [Trichonephila clavipes]